MKKYSVTYDLNGILITTEETDKEVKERIADFGLINIQSIILIQE